MSDPTAPVTNADYELAPASLSMRPSALSVCASDSPEWNRHLASLSYVERRAAVKARRRAKTLTNPYPFWAHK